MNKNKIILITFLIVLFMMILNTLNNFEYFTNNKNKKNESDPCDNNLTDKEYLYHMIRIVRISYHSHLFFLSFSSSIIIKLSYLANAHIGNTFLYAVYVIPHARLNTPVIPSCFQSPFTSCLPFKYATPLEIDFNKFFLSFAS